MKINPTEARIRRYRRQRDLLLLPWLILAAPVSVPYAIGYKVWKTWFRKGPARAYTGPPSERGGVLTLAWHLWAGAPDEAAAALRAALDDPDLHPLNRAEAALQLAIRAHFDGDRKGALALLDRAGALDPDLAQGKRLSMIRAILALEAGDAAAAAATLDALPAAARDIDTALLRANVVDGDAARLAAINAALAAAGLAGLSLRDPARPLGIDNIAADPPPAGTVGKVSVVVPAWNAAGTIGTALRSLREQSHADLEILVVDDCSTDDTPEVVRRVAAEDPRVRLIRQQANGGAYLARNAGLAQATGDYLTTHDADDWSHPEMVARQLRALAGNPAAVAVVTPWVRTDPDLRFTSNWRLSESLLHWSYSSLLIRRTAFAEIGPFDPVRFGGDAEYVQRILRRYGKQGLFMAEKGHPLAFAREAATSLTRRKDSHVSTVFHGLRQLYAEGVKYANAQPDFGSDANTALRHGLIPGPMRARREDAPVPLSRALVGDVRSEAVCRRMIALAGAETGLVGVWHRPELDPEASKELHDRHFDDAYFALRALPNVVPLWSRPEGTPEIWVARSDLG